ncbi:MAG: hypothetical protein WC003_13325, partial [Terrimicrobiaceae bacterium]
IILMNTHATTIPPVEERRTEKGSLTSEQTRHYDEEGYLVLPGPYHSIGCPAGTSGEVHLALPGTGSLSMITGARNENQSTAP